MITCTSVLLIALLAFGILHSGYIVFVAAYNMGKYNAAKSIQEWSFNSNNVKSKIETFVIGKMEDCYDDFSAEKITYEEADEKFDIAKDFTRNKGAKNKVEKLQASRTSFAKAEEYEKNGDIYNAVIEYQKVIEEDKNYGTAKEKIEKNKPSIKEEAISRMNDCVAVNDFNTGLKIVYDMGKIFPNDSDFNNYRKDFENRREAYRIQGLKDNQKVKIINAYAYYSIHRKACIIWQNNSDKVIKEATFVILQYDSNGYPVDAEYDTYKYNDVDNSYRCLADEANVAPGGTYGRGYFWDIDDKAAVIKACVQTVKFTDGTTWTNPYLKYWLEAER